MGQHSRLTTCGVVGTVAIGGFGAPSVLHCLSSFDVALLVVAFRSCTQVGDVGEAPDDETRIACKVAHGPVTQASDLIHQSR